MRLSGPFCTTGWREDFKRLYLEFLYSTGIIKNNQIRFSGAYLEDEVFLIEYLQPCKKAGCRRRALYVYFINPASVTRNYLKNYPEVFRNSLEQKKRLVMHYHIGGIDGWELHTCWAGLLIAVGNEFAPGNPAGLFSKTQESVRIMQRPGFS